MFRVSIREILLVTLAVGLALGWWIDRSLIRKKLNARIMECHRDAKDFAYYGIANGKLLWKNDPGLYGRMSDYLIVSEQWAAEDENRERFPEDKDK
jgi:hypothetical protein